MLYRGLSSHEPGRLPPRSGANARRGSDRRNLAQAVRLSMGAHSLWESLSSGKRNSYAWYAHCKIICPSMESGKGDCQIITRRLVLLTDGSTPVTPGMSSLIY